MPLVSVTGTVMEIVAQEDKKEPGKINNNAILFQPGERELLRVRLVNGDVPELGDVKTYQGRILAWKTRDGIGMMVMEE